MQSFSLSESSTDMAVLSRVQGKLITLLDKWPLRPVAELKLVGLDGDEMKDVVRREVTRVKGIAASSFECALRKMQLIRKEGEKALKGIDANDEAAFRAAMVKSSKKLATTHSNAKEVFDQVVAACKNMGKDFKSEEPAAYESSRMMIAMCLYNVCVYTALTFYRSPATWKKTKEGAKALEHMKLVLGTLGEDQDVLQVEIHFEHEVLKSMRTEAEAPRPVPSDTAEQLNLAVPTSGPSENPTLSAKEKRALRRGSSGTTPKRRCRAASGHVVESEGVQVLGDPDTDLGFDFDMTDADMGGVAPSTAPIEVAEPSPKADLTTEGERASETAFGQVGVSVAADPNQVEVGVATALSQDVPSTVDLTMGEHVASAALASPLTEGAVD